MATLVRNAIADFGTPDDVAMLFMHDLSTRRAFPSYLDGLLSKMETSTGQYRNRVLDLIDVELDRLEDWVSADPHERRTLRYNSSATDANRNAFMFRRVRELCSLQQIDPPLCTLARLTHCYLQAGDDEAARCVMEANGEPLLEELAALRLGATLEKPMTVTDLHEWLGACSEFIRKGKLLKIALAFRAVTAAPHLARLIETPLSVRVSREVVRLTQRLKSFNESAGTYELGDIRSRYVSSKGRRLDSCVTTMDSLCHILDDFGDRLGNEQSVESDKIEDLARATLSTIVILRGSLATNFYADSLESTMHQLWRFAARIQLTREALGP